MRKQGMAWIKQERRTKNEGMSREQWKMNTRLNTKPCEIKRGREYKKKSI
jgi:hypothetical protein